MGVKIEDLGLIAADFRFPLRVGEGSKLQTVFLTLPHDEPAANALWEKQQSTPVSLFEFLDPPGNENWPEIPILVYRRRVVKVETGFALVTESARNEVILRVKKFVLRSKREIQALRLEVEALEQIGTINCRTRTPIPSGVRIAVWHRDGGKCIKCGAGDNLHFDHIIPVAKGGASTIENIELLCARCNMQKSDKIT